MDMKGEEEDIGIGAASGGSVSLAISDKPIR